MVACGLTTVLSHMARERGRITQSKLIQQWGALPTTLWLRHSNNSLDKQTKQRYHHFLEQKVSGWIPPTEQEESLNPTEADAKYGSAVKWLLEHTRDKKKYSLILKENISYGFRRNTYGLKPFGLLLSLVIFTVGILCFYKQPVALLIDKNLPQLCAIIFCFMMFLWWVFGVTKEWVRDSADAYARSLLAACEKI